jgi:RNA-directed DNA polymerase
MKCLARRIADGAVLSLIKMWLRVPVEERDEKGRPRYSGGKRSKQGTPQGGVISPLLANIYLNRLHKVFAASELGRKHGARIISYADDFVVVARKGAAEVLTRVKRWLERMKLTLNESKTCIRNGTEECFRFLGYELGPMMNHRTRRRYLGARPSKKAWFTGRSVSLRGHPRDGPSAEPPEEAPSAATRDEPLRYVEVHRALGVVEVRRFLRMHAYA